MNIAHRGASGYAPENTFAAYFLALKMKSDYLEIDVQMSRDGELVLIHDKTVERTTDGNGLVSEKTLHELKELDAGEWFSGEFKNERIPTLPEVFATFRTKVGFLIELKNPSLYPGIEEKLVRTLESFRLAESDQIIVQSFDEKAVQRIKKRLPKISVGVLVKYSIWGISSAKLKEISTYATYVNPNRRLITKKLVKRIHQNSMKVIPYAVYRKKTIQSFYNLGVDGIICDYPDLVAETQKAR
ncbi:glycerophosphodiester phosphodiesterase [Priestia endophytica]|uniref:glycerophosphodiester phosphodiesterase n=1 Tax=Priestia endophytica TaxID=135735 RepID=UPI000DCA8A60|nr:glycerophosphodiester phosphodiesterase family protein [Priestia endophytica]RAS74329.1 glycerophosphodiester phosphodiesterase [Priestia endophytica]